jgi:hypothetical protein
MEFQWNPAEENELVEWLRRAKSYGIGSGNKPKLFQFDPSQHDNEQQHPKEKHELHVTSTQ